MSKINVDTWEPESGTAATLMASGDTVTLPNGAILAVASGGDINVASGGEIDIASGATLDVNGTIDVTGATTTGFPGGGFAGMQVYTAASTWTKATREAALGVTITKLIVDVQGAGGGGAKANTSSTSYVCGSAGGFARKLLDVTNIDTVTVTVGAGGPSMDTYDTAGNAGGLSKFEKATGSGSFTDIIGNGGLGGTYSSYATVAGGSATGGDINITGGNGTGGGEWARGGNAIWGSGGMGKYNGRNTGSVARGYGSGGGGGYQTPSGLGGDGIVIVQEYQ